MAHLASKSPVHKRAVQPAGSCHVTAKYKGKQKGNQNDRSSLGPIGVRWQPIALVEVHAKTMSHTVWYLTKHVVGVSMSSPEAYGQVSIGPYMTAKLSEWQWLKPHQDSNHPPSLKKISLQLLPSQGKGEATYDADI